MTPLFLPGSGPHPQCAQPLPYQCARDGMIKAHKAFDRLNSELDTLQKALDAGISLEVIGALNRIILGVRG